MPEEDKSKDILEIVATGGLGALLAMCFQAVRASRERGVAEFNRNRYTVGLISAGAVGAMVSWGLASIGVNRQLSAVIIAMCGYVGGPLLDICYVEIQETIRAGFNGLQDWLKKSRWDKDA